MRLEGIDLLRGIAVSVVVFYHFAVILGLTDSPIFQYIYSLGLLGVPLFFIISGYLIYRSIDYSISNKGIKVGLKQYAYHRLFRILPAYYFNFAVVLIMATFVISVDYLYSLGFVKQIIAHLTFLSFFMYRDSGLGINGAYWTLSIEMLWYIVAPLFFIYIKKDRYLVLLFILSFLYLTGIDFSLYDSIFNLDKQASDYFPLLFYISFQLPGQLIYFIAGIFIYKYFNKQRSLSLSVQYFLSILSISFFIYVSNQNYFQTSFAIRNFFILFTVVVLFILMYQSKLKWMGGLEWIGKISYSLYLWHMPILYTMKQTDILTHLNLWLVIIVFSIFLLAISSLSYYFIEEGGFHLRRKFEHRIGLKDSNAK